MSSAKPVATIKKNMPYTTHLHPISDRLPIQIARQAYRGLWYLLKPVLRCHPRLKPGWSQRSFRIQPIPPVDLWIQAASAGEAYLAQMLVHHLEVRQPTRLWLTTNTAQGLQILQETATAMETQKSLLNIQVGYCPLDQPKIIQQVMAHCPPRVMVLLESELWPALMAEIQRAPTSLILANGRMSANSWRHYRLWPSFWRAMAPNHILAISPEDAQRFDQVFKPTHLEVMPNIKFDRMALRASGDPNGKDHLKQLLPPGHPFVVLGSVRKSEEPLVLKILQQLSKGTQQPVMGLFPRHMERIAGWRRRLAGSSLNWILRSRLQGLAPPGSVILWDRFGELSSAYGMAWSTFVGGSLKPLGGQNFLEPLTQGIVPVIGPHWKNFSWVGRAIFTAGLVRQTNEWQGVSAALQEALQVPPDRPAVNAALKRYINDRQGGSRKVCNLLEEMLAVQPVSSEPF